MYPFSAHSIPRSGLIIEISRKRVLETPEVSADGANGPDAQKTATPVTSRGSRFYPPSLSLAYARSKIPAMPMPPPTQRVTRP